MYTSYRHFSRFGIASVPIVSGFPLYYYFGKPYFGETTSIRTISNSQRQDFDLFSNYSNKLTQKDDICSDNILNEDINKKQVVVIGGGVAGISSAMQLAKRGYQVAVFETADVVASECSKAAAGGMQRMNPTVDKKYWKKVINNVLVDRIKSIYSNNSENSAFKFMHLSPSSTLVDPHFWRWSTHFSIHSLFRTRTNEAKQNQQEMLNFTDWAIDTLIEEMKIKRDSTFSMNGGLSLEAESALSFGGALQLHINSDAMNGEVAEWTPGYPDKEETKFIGKKEVLELAPWLRNTPLHSKIKGATYQINSARANSHWFTLALAEVCESMGVTIHTGQKIIDFETEKRVGGETAVTALTTDKVGQVVLPDDCSVVVAAGSWTPLLLRKLYLYVPVYPLKGYDILVNVSEGTSMMTCSPLEEEDNNNDNNNIIEVQNESNIREEVNKIHSSEHCLPKQIVTIDNLYISRLGGQLRIASIGEFAGWNTTPDPTIANKLKMKAKTILPQSIHKMIEEGEVVCGLRPFTSDGLLIVGKVPSYSNVFVNVGPGFNGWKICMGAGELVARAVVRHSMGHDSNSLQSLPFNEHAFTPNGRITLSPFFVNLCK